jgi:diphthamide biosynthesis protein 2
MSESIEAIAAPALSTAQNEEEAFAKVEGLTDEMLREKRSHLGREYMNNKNITKEETRKLISEYYSLDKLSQFLNARDLDTNNLKYPLISLQFPDDLVCDSTIVSEILQENLNKMNKKFHDFNHEKEEEKELEKRKYENKEIDFTIELAKTTTKMSRDIESVEKTIDNKECNGNCQSNCKNKNKYNQEVWILADTSYSPCCIDEVAAEHINADIVVHFGDACLNPVDKINSCYVFGKPYIDINKLIKTFKDNYIDKNEKTIIMTDTSYSYILPKLYHQLKNEYNNLVIANIDNKKTGKTVKIIDDTNEIINSAESNTNTTNNKIYTANRILIGINDKDIDEYLETIDFDDENFIESSKFDGLTQEYSLFHITRPHDARILLLNTKFKDLKIIEPKNVEILHDQFPTLMKRYRNMQVTRSASTIGVLVNTLSLSNTKLLLNEIIKSIIEAGKKHYMFVVGKPNVAKLANFECIDVWCIIGCGQSGIVIDMFGDYYKPIVTPYELHLALKPQVTWTGKWITDFDSMLKREEAREEEEEGKNNNEEDSKNDDDDDDYAPEFDPVTGKLKMNQPLRQLRHLELELEMENNNSNHNHDHNNNSIDEKGLVKKFSGTLSVGNTVSTSALGLQGRQWTGLGSDFKEQESEEGAIVEEGRTGVARGYSGV